MLCVARVTKDPPANVLTEEKASHDESHLQPEWPRVHPPAYWLRLRRKRVMMNPVHMKSQNQSKRYTSIILILMSHNQSILICTCHTSKVWKWTGWLIMCHTTDSSGGNSNVRIFWNVNLLPSLNARSVRRSLHGLATLEWINMYPGGYPKMTWILTQYGRGLKISVNSKTMWCMPDLIFWPVSIKETRESMNGTML